MKFIMVVLICFGADCRAIYEEFRYENYDTCMIEAVKTRDYMKSTFPASSGQVYCWDEEQFQKFKEDLEKNGLDPIKQIIPDSNSISA